MGKKTSGQNFIYGILAVICLGILMAAAWGSRCRERAWQAQYMEDVRIVVFGDSIAGEYREETSVTGLMSEALGEPVFNAALGGTCYSYTDTDRRLFYTKDCLNMVGLSQSVLADDFRIQKNARIRESVTEYFENTVEDLSFLDFTQVDTVFLSHGMNDYHGGVELVNEKDLYDPYTFTGAIRSSVANLKKANPDLRIILVTPTYSWYRAEGLTCEEYDPGGGVLEEYVEAEMALAEELGLECIDLYHDFYPHEKWEDWELYTNDGLHPNEAGRRMIAEKLTDYLEGHYRKRNG